MHEKGGKGKAAKLLRKQKRCQAIVSRDMDLQCVDSPTQFLAICNAGLSTGLQKESVLEDALKFGSILDVAMINNKSFCFINCTSVDEAIRVFNGMHGVSKLGQNDSVVYMSYVNKIPDVPNPWHQNLPAGLIVLRDFISAGEEQCLLRAVKTLDDPLDKSSALKHRKVKHFGYEFLYGSNNVDVEKPLKEGIPSECNFLWSRLGEQVASSLAVEPDQLTVNIYEPGQGIPPHVDTHSAFLNPIYSLSLESDVVMEFRRGVTEHIPVLIPRRSLLIMSDEARYAWTHGITPRQMDITPSKEGGLTVERRTRRTSLTFRKLRRKSCDCSFPELCDSYKDKSVNVDRLATVAAKLEEENVHKVYDKIASHFSETRHKPWPKVEAFVNSFQTGSVLLDVGCGNGKYLGVNRNIVEIGCDRSEGLLQVCSSRKCNTFQCNCLVLPFRDNSVDGCISIAVIHHLATQVRRMQAISEMARILVSGGRCLIYVWAKNQEFNSKKSSYLHRNRNDRVLKSDPTAMKANAESAIADLPVHTNRTQFQEQDVLVPWKLNKSSIENDAEKGEFLRYYHVFEENELEKICSSFGSSIEIETSYYDQGNWCVIFRKK